MTANAIVPETDRTPDAVLFSKMAKVMGAMSRLSKSGQNQHFGYKFATSEDVADMVRAQLAEQNVAFFPSMKEVKQETIIRKNKNGERTVIRTTATFEFTFACGDTGATRTSIWHGEAEDESDKGINKVATAAEKYFLMKTFVLSSGDEKDADKEGSRGQLQSKKQETQAPEKPTTNGNDSTPLNWTLIYNELKPLFAGSAENAGKAIEVLRETGYIKPGDTSGEIIQVVKESLEKAPEPPPADVGVKAADKPDIKTSYDSFLEGVAQVTGFMHNSLPHAKNNVKRLWREKKINAEMSVGEAAVIVFLDRCANKELALTTDICKVTGIENLDTHFNQHLEDRLLTAWEKVVTWQDAQYNGTPKTMSADNPFKATVEGQS